MRKRRGRNTRRGRAHRITRPQRRRQLVRRAVISLAAAWILIVIGVWAWRRLSDGTRETAEELAAEGLTQDDWVGAPEIDVQLLDVNEYSRPQIALSEINGIVIHYTANPGSSAQANRDYFEGLKDAHTTKASSHFIVGLEGEIIQCIPSSEIAYASNDRNSDTLAIECCHPDETGQFNDATYTSVVQLTAWLCSRFDLTSSDVIRHYDVTGKLCPLYFVEHEDAWTAFRQDVDARIEEIAAMKDGESS